MRTVTYELREISGDIIGKIVGQADGLAPATCKNYLRWGYYFKNRIIKRRRWKAEDAEAKFNLFLQDPDLFDPLAEYKKHLVSSFNGSTPALGLMALSAIFQRLLVKNYIVKNPFADRDLQPNGLASARTKDRTIDDGEYSKIKEKVMIADTLSKAAFLVLTSSGLRINEFLGIRREDIFDRWIYITRGKAGKTRHVRINAEAKEALSVYLQGLLINGEIFPGTALKYWRVMKKLAAQAGVNSNFTNHSLRNRFIFTSRRAGLPENYCAWLSGHSAGQTMNGRYNEQNLSEFKNLCEKEYDQIEAMLT